MGFLSRAERWELDIDYYLNRILPASPLHRLPSPVSRFLGYREVQKDDVGNVLGAFWSLFGAFCGLAVVAAVFNNTTSIQVHSPPALIASFGASAVLEYNTIRSPLGQPRNALLGHTFSAIIGVAITKFFRLHSDFEKIRWIAGAVSCGVASGAMLLTGTVHPPGGASAVLAATSPEITEMGWFFVGLVMLGTTLMLLVGLITNNIQRQFPMYWWTPLDLSKMHEIRKDARIVSDTESGIEGKGSFGEKERRREISISSFDILLPGDLSLDFDEAKFLETLRERLRKTDSTEDTAQVPSSRSSLGFGKVPSRASSSTAAIY